MRTIKIELDTARQDERIEVDGILQGNQNVEFEVRLAEDGEPIAIADIKKPKIIWRYTRIGVATTLAE
ncbi:hypothetical protein MHBO_003231, partial [Bonamia ostreae]